jgi:hypothetical protein
VEAVEAVDVAVVAVGVARLGAKEEVATSNGNKRKRLVSRADVILAFMRVFHSSNGR